MDSSAVASAVVAHYTRDRRDLPWRRTRDPYAIWVSEIMLQQTRVQTVIPYWERWMTRFPTVRALAEAPLDDVLAAWAGLGYYSRARNLHAGAQAVATKWAGALPSRAAELREVPGIGPYTAGAIASIAFGERAPLVDGNVARVLARAYGITEDIKSTAGQKALWSRAGEVMAALPAGHAPGDLNQGLMELGATTCAPTSPRCLVCPLAQLCVAARTGRQDELPVVPARKKESELPILSRAAVWIEADGHVVLARRSPEGLFGGLWELPQGDDRLEIAKALGVTAIDDEPIAY
ncbi:MAG TPA: A/G-specific adenine glycosylase, partial [Kofleriaceae bacterium]|nr:A/G-specific adenine glycosylase [Kofleriaceae bacterium]